MDFWQQYGLIILGLIVCGFVVRQLLRRKPTPVEKAVAEEVARTEYESLPKCVCGEVAKYPAPLLGRDRGAWDWLRKYFAAPPRYKRGVDMMLPPVFCEAHVHVADAELDKFIFRVRSEYSAFNARVAGEAACFEQESLLKLVAESLTENQKRAVRRAPATIRVLPQRTGTDDAPGSDGG